MKRCLLTAINLVFVLVSSGLATAQIADPLPSWSDGKIKESIIEFVTKVTKQGSLDFVPTAERIAVFDNDGTLWSEQPMYFQLFFAIDRVKALAAEHPEWKDKEPFASLLQGDVKAALAGGEHALLELVMATHTGMTTTEFEQIVKDWIATAKHPTTKRPFTEMVYQPMLEVLAYLRANGFKTFIVSGGGIEFMRAWAETVYGIPPEQVVGSSIKTKFEMRDSKPVLVRLPELNFIDDKEGKPVGINQHIGRRPIAAFGNSDGDLQMLQWTTAGQGPRFALYVHHTDGDREWAYDRKSSIGRFDKGLDEAQAKGWTVVDMKRDWKLIYPHETLIAIDVLIQPGLKMMTEAERWNVRMREQSPKGFELDEEHAPQVTLIQRFVAKTDLPKVLAAVDEVKSKFDMNSLEMTATGLYHIPAGKIGLAGIVIEPSKQLLALQQAVIEAVNVYARKGGRESAFVPDKSGTPFNPFLFKYVDTFVPHQTGKKFNPHVTIGVAPLGWLEDLEKKPFKKFTFGAKGIATYQLGNFGTASKRLDRDH